MSKRSGAIHTSNLIPLILAIQKDPDQFFINYFVKILDFDLRNEVKRAPELVFTHTRPKNLVEAGSLVARYERLLKQEKSERSQLHCHKHRASRGGHRSHQGRRSQRNPSCHSHSEAYHAPKRRGFGQMGSQQSQAAVKVLLKRGQDWS